MITGGGILILGIIGIIVVIIVFINAWAKGASINLEGIRKLKSLRFKDAKQVFKKKEDDGTVLCLNITEREIRGTSMLAKSIDNNSDTWTLGGKAYRVQGIKDKEYVYIGLPQEISYPPERLARMMGCMPYRKLKSLKFGLLERLAPFAPVAAIGIGGLLWILIL